MRKELVRYGLAAGMLVGLGLSGAEAAAARPIAPEALGLERTATPAAMCGHSCRRGGFYVPGPPSVCFARGLNYCGSSRGGPPPWAGRGDYERGRYGPRPSYRDPDRRGPYGRPYGW